MEHREEKKKRQEYPKLDLLSYIKRHGDGLNFAKHFWNGCELNPRDKRVYSKYTRAVYLQNENQTVSEISRRIDVTPRFVNNWLNHVTKPKMVRYLEAYLKLGVPRKGCTWLSINNSAFHASPEGPFIEVPARISNWRSLKGILRRLKPIGPTDERTSRVYQFGFLLGMLIGDAAKKRQREWHRHIELVLSKKYKTNLRIGNFTSRCANALGLRMSRRLDRAPYGDKPNGFYCWTSQSSPLVDWLFNVCLGLRNNELTTYHSVRMEWSLHASKEFKRGLVHGMAESDGSVSIASQTVEFWIGPNWDFVRRLLLTFRVKSFKNREALSVTKGEIANLRRIPPFAPQLRTVRYNRFEKLANARHISHGTRVPRDIRETISKAAQRGKSNPEISEMIVDKFGIVLGFEAIQRWAMRGRSADKPRLVN